MPIEIKIKYDGVARWLTEHRLSLGEMGEALPALVKAARAAATAVMRKHTGEQVVARADAAANALDLQVTAIGRGSVGLAIRIECEPPVGAYDPLLWQDLDRQTAVRLVEDLDAAARGKTSSKAALAYLKKVPPSVRKQQYSAYADNLLIRETSFDGVTLPEQPKNPPRVHMVRGTLSSVFFEPGDERVVVRAEGRLVKLSCTAEFLDKAVPLRGVDVEVTAVLGVTNERALGIRRLGEPIEVNEDKRWDYISKKWAGTFAELAK